MSLYAVIVTWIEAMSTLNLYYLNSDTWLKKFEERASEMDYFSSTLQCNKGRTEDFFCSAVSLWVRQGVISLISIFFRNNPKFRVVCFTITQIPNIADRKYPRELGEKTVFAGGDQGLV